MDDPHRPYGAQSMTAPLREVLVRAPDGAFGRAFDEPAHGFRHAVDLAEARRQHDAFCSLLAALGVEVHFLEGEGLGPDSIYTYDALLVTERGALPLRSGKPTRSGEEKAAETWARARGIPTLGRITAPGTVDGGDTFWLRPDLFCVGRSLRTNRAGAAQLAGLVGGGVEVFDVSVWRGSAEVLHLLSVISPVSDELAVVFPPLLPAGLHELLGELGVRTLAVDEHEFETLGCNVLAVRPGVVVLAEGNRRIATALALAGCEVHTFAASEIGLNGSGGPTCLTRPIWRET
ncbi:MAG TPA: arginine deiminase family protein [Candidatus Limnocylindria bacterium]|nr:arginine deiminase family protein [Candidatus Limnocylindria bacterium]